MVWLLRLLILICWVGVHHLGISDAAPSVNKTGTVINLGGMYRPTNDAGQAKWAVMTYAVDLINNQTAILPNNYLRIFPIDAASTKYVYRS